MTKSKKFMAFVYDLVSEHMQNRKVASLEQLSVKASVYDIFNSSHDLEYIFYGLLDYLEEQESLRDLIPEIEKHFLNAQY